VPVNGIEFVTELIRDASQLGRSCVNFFNRERETMLDISRHRVEFQRCERDSNQYETVLDSEHMFQAKKVPR
jgi:hypothetical protein